VIGFGKGEHIVVSNVSATLYHTRDLFFLMTVIRQ
jgi:glucosamine 6-phosphate synthetase-like amidotransferase/phosphosugar isomerase protein